MSFLSLHQQVHQSTPLPGVPFLSVFPPLPNQPAVHPSPIHLSIHPLPTPLLDPFIHGGQRRSRGDKIGGESKRERERERHRERGGDSGGQRRKKKGRIGRGEIERREGRRGVKGEDCGGDTVWPCAGLMYLWRKRIVDRLAHTDKKTKHKTHTHKDTYTHPGSVL